MGAGGAGNTICCLPIIRPPPPCALAALLVGGAARCLRLRIVLTTTPPCTTPTTPAGASHRAITIVLRHFFNMVTPPKNEPSFFRNPKKWKRIRYFFSDFLLNSPQSIITFYSLPNILYFLASNILAGRKIFCARLY